MAKTVYTPEEISLQDGHTVVLKPLPIARLKRAMNFMSDNDNVETEDDSYDFLLNLVKICIENQLPEPEDGSEYALDEVLDIVTGKRIIAVCTGVDFDSPNLISLAAEAAQSGQN